MEIPKVGLGRYDAQHIQALRAGWARSVKPNAFPETPEEVQVALVLAGIDILDLSPEAKLILKKLRKGLGEELEEVDWAALLAELKEARNGHRRKTERNEKKNSELNLVTLPVMRPPLPEILPRERGTANEKATPAIGPLRRILARMIARAPNSAVRERLMDELELLQAYVVNTCRDFGVRILILGRKEKISDLKIHGMALAIKGERTRDGRLKDNVRGFYYEDRRLMILGEEQIGIPGRFVSVHEMAHAYDHTFSEKHYQTHFLSTRLWNLFSSGRRGLITDYAGTSPAEYFAESMEGYFLEDGRKWLAKNDPQMHEFLRNLFL